MRLISRSVWRKLMATVVAILGFVLLYEVTIRDSRDASLANFRDASSVIAGSRLPFEATAYCKGTTTASGVNVRTGIAAADPGLLPVGSVVSVATGDAKYNGVYTIMDTGPSVQGPILDLYMWSCNEALAFGRKHVQVTVLRLGWNPRATSPSLIDTLFRRRDAARRRPEPPEVPALIESAPETTGAPATGAEGAPPPASDAPAGTVPAEKAPN